MEFEVRRASGSYEESPPPCPGAAWKKRHGRAAWWVEVATLKDLMEMAFKQGALIVSVDVDEMRRRRRLLVVYDDYIE